jgi:hypothetical protein
MPQPQLKELKPPSTIRQKINFLTIILIVLVFGGCSSDCKHSNEFPSKNFSCTIVRNTPEIKGFFFFNSAITNLETITVIVDNEKLIQGAVISLYSANSLLCRYKVIELNSSYSIIETDYPLDKIFSWKFQQNRYKLIVCLDTITFNNFNGSNIDKGLILSLKVI